MAVIHTITLRLLCLIFALSTLPIRSFGQDMGDTVIVYIDERVEVSIAVPDYTLLKSSDRLAAALSAFQEVIPAIGNQLASGTAELVRYTVDGSIRVEAGDPAMIYLRKNGALSLTGVRDQAILRGEGFDVFITTADLSTLPNLPLVLCLENVIAELPAKSRWSKSLYYTCTEGTVRLLESRNNEYDFLELNLGAGAGLVKSQWVPDLSLGAGIGFNRKGKVSFIGLSSNLLFDFDAEGNPNLNTFLNLGYGWNMSKDVKKKDILGVEIGYLVSRQGDLFGDNTLKLGFNWSPVKGVFVSPQLYLTDDFNTLYPGIRIGLGF